MISEEVLDKKRNNDETEKMEGEKSFTLFTRRQCDNDEFVSRSLNKYIYIYGMWTLYDYGRANVEYARALSNY